LDPTRLAQIKSRDDYVALAKSRVAHDEIIYLNKAGEALWVDALPLSPELMAAGQARWAGDKRRSELLGQWSPPEGPPARIVLVGLYVKGLNKDDVLKTGRFRFELKDGGQTLEPLEIFEVKPDIWSDYFPVFSRWEKVFAVRFPAVSSDGGRLVVHWPAGEREIDLSPGIARSSR
jgi:hypothetical protein